MAAGPGRPARRDRARRISSGWEIQGGLVTQGTRRLLSSLFDTYDRSKVFYARRRSTASTRSPTSCTSRRTTRPWRCWSATGTTTSAWTRWCAAVADEAGATVVLDAGDDTSTGETWEAVQPRLPGHAPSRGTTRGSLIAGNHDNGTFVNRHLALARLDPPRRRSRSSRSPTCGSPASTTRARAGWAPGATRPTSASTRSRTGIADDVCELDEKGERIATLLVHDANLGAYGAGARVHRPGARRTPARAGRPEPAWSATNGKVGLHLHQRDDRRGGVRHRDREQAAPRRDVHLRHLPRRSAGRHPAGDRAHDRGALGRRLHRRSTSAERGFLRLDLRWGHLRRTGPAHGHPAGRWSEPARGRRAAEDARPTHGLSPSAEPTARPSSPASGSRRLRRHRASRPRIRTVPAQPRAPEPRRSFMTIPALGVRDVPVVRYRGSPDDGPGTRIQNGGVMASPRGPGGGVGPGVVGNFIVTGHRTSHNAPLAELPRAGARTIACSCVGRPPASSTGSPVRARPRSARRPRWPGSRAAVPGRPGATPVRPMITLSTCATPEDHAAGNYWADEFGNPEHRIDKIGVLTRVRSAG